MQFIQKHKEKPIAIAKAHGLRGDVGVEREALDYYADDLDIGINKTNISAFLTLIDGFASTDKFLDGSYLNQASAFNPVFWFDAADANNARKSYQVHRRAKARNDPSAGQGVQ
jgi:hypothetical protein